MTFFGICLFLYFLSGRTVMYNKIYRVTAESQRSVDIHAIYFSLHRIWQMSICGTDE